MATRGYFVKREVTLSFVDPGAFNAWSKAALLMSRPVMRRTGFISETLLLRAFAHAAATTVLVDELDLAASGAGCKPP